MDRMTSIPCVISQAVQTHMCTAAKLGIVYKGDAMAFEWRDGMLMPAGEDAYSNGVAAVRAVTKLLYDYELSKGETGVLRFLPYCYNGYGIICERVVYTDRVNDRILTYQLATMVINGDKIVLTQHNGPIGVAMVSGEPQKLQCTFKINDPDLCAQIYSKLTEYKDLIDKKYHDAGMASMRNEAFWKHFIIFCVLVIFLCGVDICTADRIGYFIAYLVACAIAAIYAYGHL